MVVNGADLRVGIKESSVFTKNERDGEASFNKNYQVRILWTSKKEYLIVFSKVLPS